MNLPTIPTPAPARERDLCECGRPVAPRLADWCGHCVRHAGPIHISTAIPINQSLPPIGERVLAFVPSDNRTSSIVNRHSGQWHLASRHSRWINSHGHIIHPSHWQHLPAAR